MATGATEFIDSTTAAVFQPTIWSKYAIVQREQALVFAALVDRRFEAELKYGDRIRIPTVGNLAARTKSLASNAAITYETITETNLPAGANFLLVATHEYAAIAVEDIVEVQSDRDQFELYAGKMGYALALSIDDVLAGLPDDQTNNVGALGTPLGYDDYVRARQYLLDENAPRENWQFIISPAEESGLLKMDQYVHNDYSVLHGDQGRATDLERAYTTSFLRTPVYVTTNVEGTNAAGHDNTLFQKEAFALVLQMSPKTKHMYDIDQLADKVVMENVYGTATMRDNATYGRYAVWCQGA